MKRSFTKKTAGKSSRIPLDFSEHTGSAGKLKVATKSLRIPADFAENTESAGKIHMFQKPQQNPQEYLRIYFRRKIVNF
jgi:hypothetical protein